jgi:hypothetical protein
MSNPRGPTTRSSTHSFTQVLDLFKQLVHQRITGNIVVIVIVSFILCQKTHEFRPGSPYDSNSPSTISKTVSAGVPSESLTFLKTLTGGAGLPAFTPGPAPVPGPILALSPRVVARPELFAGGGRGGSIL